MEREEASQRLIAECPNVFTATMVNTTDAEFLREDAVPQAVVIEHHILLAPAS